MQFEKIIFVETSVLLNSCLRTGGKDDDSDIRIESERYSQSLGLINKGYKSDGCCVITSRTVENEAVDTLDTAIRNTIEDAGLNYEENIDELSIITDDCERKLNKNLEKVDRLAVNQSIRQEKVTEVAEIYDFYAKKYDRVGSNVRTWSHTPKLKGLAIGIRKMEKEKLREVQKRIDEKGGIVGINDVEIVADALALKEERFSEDIILYLSSNDQHIAGGFVEPWNEIRRDFESNFSILPRFPDEVLSEI